MYNRENDRAEAERLREHDAEIAERAVAEAERVREHEWRMLTERQRADVSAAPVPEIVQVRLPDWTGDTKPETYLEMAEKLLTSSGIDESLWVGHLVRHLSEKAREVYARMATEDGLRQLR